MLKPLSNKIFKQRSVLNIVSIRVFMLTLHISKISSRYLLASKKSNALLYASKVVGSIILHGVKLSSCSCIQLFTVADSENAQEVVSIISMHVFHKSQIVLHISGERFLAFCVRRRAAAKGPATEITRMCQARY